MKGRNKRSRIITRLCVSLLAVWMFVQTDVNVLAGNGSLAITLKDLQSEYSDPEGVVFTLYQVGSISDTGYPEIDQQLYTGDYPENSEQLDALAKELAASVTATQSGKTPLQTIKTNQDGKGAFAGLEEGVYLICSEDGNPYGKISPFLVNLPYYVEVQGSVTGPFYDAEIAPKASIVVPDPDPTPDPKPGTTTNNSTSNNTTSTVTPPAENMISPKTGDTAPAAEWLLAAVVLMMGLMIGLKKGEEESCKRKNAG